ncbi:unnamed protein product [Lepeophtheirus salmonis]|uniref:(salmon louse) hypothetical protein n=1 Tax=Lepeophtheirus salmonis TaxID=72036 RepID=A0A7R8CLM4_LEPSM|nr:unnamed protein product [Lepeophtheirus salmonis]CAF2813613.1 unnamed protein product [Lepeophtheirus salmonis]
MTIEDKRYSNATTITSSEADYDDDGYFASVVTVQHSQNSNKGTQDLEWKKVTWPSESEGLQHLQSHTSTVEGHETHHKVLHSNDFITKEKSKKGFEMEEKAFGWIHQVAETSHHLVSDAEMELQKRAFDVKHANDRSRSRTKSNFITNRARSFERAHIAGSNEALPPPLRRRSPSLRRNDEIWISRPESRSGEEEQMKNRHRWNSVGRLNTSAWENRIRCESPAPHPPPIERYLRRRRLTGEEMTPPPRSAGRVPNQWVIKGCKVTEWIRKSHDCLIQNEQNHQSYYETQESSTQSSQTTQHDVHNNESEAIRFRQEQLRHMEEEKNTVKKRKFAVKETNLDGGSWK